MTARELQKVNRTEFYRPLAVLSGIILFYYLVRSIGVYHPLTNLALRYVSAEISYLRIFEKHFYQFAVSMIAMTLLSRGHLWSYGINSLNIGQSMAFIGKFYLWTIPFFVFTTLFHIPLDIEGGRSIGMPAADRIVIILIQWMSSPVADQIMFFGLFQTMLMKNWQPSFTIFSHRLPVASIVTILLFTVGRIGLSFSQNIAVELIEGLFVGTFSSLVYDRTKSLLAPMLAQAFFFGMPFAIRFTGDIF